MAHRENERLIRSYLAGEVEELPCESLPYRALVADQELAICLGETQAGFLSDCVLALVVWSIAASIAMYRAMAIDGR